MNANDFKIQTATVHSVMAVDAGTEIWVELESGVESVYLVPDESFRAREGHKLTAISCGRHVVALRNDNTYKKIQLLTGEDLLGPGPEVRPKSGKFWLMWAFFICCPGILVAGIPAAILSLFGDNVILKILESLTIIVTYLSFIFGIPFWFIIRPRLLRRKHQQRVKAADEAIAQIFNPL